jgi:hypothetical protein
MLNAESLISVHWVSSLRFYFLPVHLRLHNHTIQSQCTFGLRLSIAFKTRYLQENYLYDSTAMYLTQPQTTGLLNLWLEFFGPFALS